MKNKTTKFLLKIALFFPLGVLFWLIINGIDNFSLFISIVIGFMFSFGIVFWNLFDYEKYDEISYEDFLESTHTITLESTDENWTVVSEVLKNRFINLKTLELKSSSIKTEIERKFTDSILTAERTPTVIVLKIERKSLKFLPDNASNYGVLKKISKQLASNN